MTISRKSSIKKIERSGIIFAICMLAFPVVWTLIFYFGVNIKSWIDAFRITARGQTKWSLINFKTFFLDLKNPLPSDNTKLMFLNTFLVFVCSDLVQLPLCILLSYVFFKKIRLNNFFRVIFYVPSLISMVALSEIFFYIIGPKGPLSAIASWFGVEEFPALLGQTKTAFTTIMVFNLWSGCGYTIILISGVMARLPVEVFESAKLDGCKMGRELFNIVIPLIWPTISMIFVLNITQSFMYFGPIMMLTNGAYNTTTIGLYIYSKTSLGIYNYPAAIGLLMSVILLPIVLTLQKVFNKISAEVEF